MDTKVIIGIWSLKGHRFKIRLTCYLKLIFIYGLFTNFFLSLTTHPLVLDRKLFKKFETGFAENFFFILIF